METGAANSRKVLVRRIVAAIFLFLILAEWGAHGAFHINNPTAGLAAVSAEEQHRDAPGHSLAICSDSRQRDRQQPASPHDLIPSAGLSDGMLYLAPVVRFVEPSLSMGTADELSRPPDPHFRPPQFS